MAVLPWTFGGTARLERLDPSALPWRNPVGRVKTLLSLRLFGHHRHIASSGARVSVTKIFPWNLVGPWVVLTQSTCDGKRSR